MLRFRRVLLRFMLSSVTNEPFPPGAQTLLSDAYDTRGFTSPYWCTLAQARRSLNVDIRPGEHPTKIFLAVEEVVPFRTLPSNVSRMILDDPPPYFAGGVGILAETFKWNSVLAARLVHRLNPEGDERVLFIEKKFAGLGAEFSAKEMLTFEMSLRCMYNGMTDGSIPCNAGTWGGARCEHWEARASAAHDELSRSASCAATPLLIDQREEPHTLHVTLTNSGKNKGVTVSTMQGTVVALTHIRKVNPRLADELTELFHKQSHHHRLADGSQAYVYTVAGWELSKSRAMSKAYLQLLEPSELSLTKPNLFVNLRDLEANPVNHKEPLPRSELTKLHSMEPSISLDELTKKVYYNAAETDAPHYIAIESANRCRQRTPRRRPIRGDPPHRARKFSSPLWFTERGATLCGVAILPPRKRKVHH